MYGTSDFKKGLKILVKDQPYVIIDFQHVKPGKGNQFTRTKLKNLITGSNLDLTIRSGEKFKIPNVQYKDMAFLYQEGEEFYFMDKESFEQVSIHSKILGNKSRFLKPDMMTSVCFYNDVVISVELPKSVVLKIKKTDPGFKGNTVSNTFKPAELETGFSLSVPLHIQEGDQVKVNTEEGIYIERVSQSTGKKH